MGKVFRKAFRILEFSRRVVEQYFHGNFQVNELSSLWYGLKEFFTQLIRTKLSLSLTIKTDNFTSGKNDVDPQGRLQTAQGQMG